MLLTIDIGNSKIAIGIFDDKSLIARWRVATESKRTSEEYAVLFDGLFRLQRSVNRDVIKGALIASVVPHLVDTIIESIQAICSDIEIKSLDSSMDIGMKNLYQNPREVGADRLANAVGGKYIFGYPLIVVDFGTATNIDVIDNEGNYLGGAIMPGIEMSADALFQRTAKLPRIPITLPPSVIGRTTVQSLQSGICFGIVASADALIERIWEELGYKTTVVATGGYAPMLGAVSKTADAIEPYLTLYGLYYIWNINTKG